MRLSRDLVANKGRGNWLIGRRLDGRHALRTRAITQSRKRQKLEYSQLTTTENLGKQDTYYK